MSDEESTSIAHDKFKGTNFKKLYNRTLDQVVGKTFMSPQQFLDMVISYFSWAESNAVRAIETASFQGVVTENLIHKPRVFTIRGLCLYCGISAAMLTKMRGDVNFAPIVDLIDNVVYEQKYQLAVNGIINSAMVGKELGIDKPATVTVEQNNTANVDVAEFKEAVRDVLDNI